MAVLPDAAIGGPFSTRGGELESKGNGGHKKYNG